MRVQKTLQKQMSMGKERISTKHAEIHNKSQDLSPYCYLICQAPISIGLLRECGCGLQVGGGGSGGCWGGWGVGDEEWSPVSEIHVAWER